MNKLHIIPIYALLLLCLGLAGYAIWKTPEASTPEPSVANVELLQSMPQLPRDTIRLFSIPTELTFAGENVPLEIEDVRERLEREIYVNAYWQSNMILLMKRSSKFLPEIEEMLKENGIPDDFKYLAMAESALMNVASPAGAKGFWQILESTGKEYGLEVSKDVDERYNLKKATLAAYYQNPNFKTVKVSADIKNLASWAKQQGSNYKELKLYNPWLRNKDLNVKRGKTYEITLPE